MRSLAGEAQSTFPLEVYNIGPFGQCGKLSFYPPMESSLLDWVRLHPSIEVIICVMIYFERKKILCRVWQTSAERKKTGSHVIVASTVSIARRAGRKFLQPHK